MATTQVEPDAPTTSAWSWWPDRRPVTIWEPVVWLSLALVWSVLAVLGMVTGSATDDTVFWTFQLVAAASFLAQAGMGVSRPGPDRRLVIIYRTAWFASIVPLVAAAYALFLL